MKLIKQSLYFAAVLACLSCSSTSNVTPVFQPGDDSYASAYPTQNISDKITTIQQSVQRIISTVQYRVYTLDGNRITYDELLNSGIESVGKKGDETSQSNAGTAISILRNNEYTIFITAYHVIASPDTLYSFKKGTTNRNDALLQSVSIKSDEDLYLIDRALLFTLDVIAVNPEKDLALLVADNKYKFLAPPLAIQTGTAKNLGWGSVIYVLGYPLGNPMITSGLVSSPDYDGNGTFLTDALFNHGISGGIIIASNDLYQSFEWVGMSSTASVQKHSFLVPNPVENIFYNDFDIYTDTAFVDKMNFINYGVAKAISIESILQFVFNNEEKLNKYGFTSTDLLGQ